MTRTLLEQLEHLFDQRDVRLVAARQFDDGTTEFAYEPQRDEDGVSLVRIYKLPKENTPT